MGTGKIASLYIVRGTDHTTMLQSAQQMQSRRLWLTLNYAYMKKSENTAWPITRERVCQWGMTWMLPPGDSMHTC